MASKHHALPTVCNLRRSQVNVRDFVKSIPDRNMRNCTSNAPQVCLCCPVALSSLGGWTGTKRDGDSRDPCVLTFHLSPILLTCPMQIPKCDSGTFLEGRLVRVGKATNISPATPPLHRVCYTRPPVPRLTRPPTAANSTPPGCLCCSRVPVYPALTVYYTGLGSVRSLSDPLARGHVPLPLAQLQPQAPGRKDGRDGDARDGARPVPAQGLPRHFWARAR